ncbi:MAG: prepilin-type N-terminal cleavage/methylation domain-containing protein [Candidatus Gastranaerophilaceae bacterium]
MLNKNTIARFYVIARQWLSALTKGIHRSNLSCGRTLARLPRRNFVSPRNDENALLHGSEHLPPRNDGKFRFSSPVSLLTSHLSRLTVSPRNDTEKLTFRPFNRSTFQPAFTLAEVLITLGIIGVVAGLMIPGVIAESQKAGYVAGARKAYSLWNQALIQMAADGGCIGDLSCFFDSADTKTMGDKIAAYFNVAKNCDTTTTGCFSDTIALNFDGSSTVSGKDGGSYRFITADGMSVRLVSPYSGCSGSAGSLTKICMYYVYIDINGLKKPNAFGRDIFFFMIDNTNGPALYPWGGAKYAPWKTNKYCDYGYNNGTNKQGMYCIGRIIDEGWQMNY